MNESENNSFEKIYDEYVDLNGRFDDRVASLRCIIDRIEGAEQEETSKGDSSTSNDSFVSRFRSQNTKFCNLNDELDRELDRLTRHF